MPTTPYAKLLVSLNGGPTQSGGVTGSPGDTVQLSAESTAQWDVTNPPRWEIYAYPPGWTGPAAGWVTESVPQAGGGTADVFVYLGLGPPPAFLLPALPMWGKFLTKLTVQGGLLNGLPSPQLVDNTTGVQTIGPNGLLDMAVGEEGQFDGARAWVGPWQEDLRLLDAALAGAATPYAVLPEPVEIGAGSAGGVNQYARGDHAHPVTVGTPSDIGLANAAGGGTALAGAAHVHALTFTTTNAVLATANAAITVNGQTLTSGGFIGPYFSTNAANPATTGLLRGANATTLAAARNAANSASIAVLATDASDNVIVGDGTAAVRLVGSGAAGVDLRTPSASVVGFTLLGQRFGPTATFFITQDPPTAAGDGLNALIKAGNANTLGAGGTIEIQPGDAADGGALGDIRLEALDDGTTSGFLYFAAGTCGDVHRRNFDCVANELIDATAPGNTWSQYGALGMVFSTDSGYDVAINRAIWARDVGVSLFVSPDLGGGEKVLHIGDADTAPAAVPATGMHAWKNPEGLYLRNTTNVLDVIAPVLLTGTGIGEDLRATERKVARLQTTTAGTTTIITYALPEKCTCDFVATILAYTTTGPARARYVVTGAAGRLAAAGATLIGTTDTDAKEDAGAAVLNGSVTVSGNNLVVQVTADNFTVEWFAELDVKLMSPA